MTIGLDLMYLADCALLCHPDQEHELNHGRFHIFTSEQLLHCANIMAIFKEMSGKLWRSV